MKNAKQMIVYFDRNVFNHVYYGIRGVDEKGRTQLRKAIRSKKIRLLLSIVTLSETLIMGDVRSAIEEAQWTIRFSKQRRVVKDTPVLINDSIIAYAKKKPVPTPYNTTVDLSRLLHPTSHDIQGLLRAVEVYKQQRSEFVQAVTAILENERKKYDSIKEVPNFSNFREERAWEWIESLANRAGVVEKCRLMGFGELANLKTIRLAVCPPLLLTYGEIFKDRSLEEADYGDIHHLVTAAPANIFVTHDAPLRNLLHRLSIPDFEVLKVRELVQRLG